MGEGGGEWIKRVCVNIIIRGVLLIDLRPNVFDI